MSRIGNFLNEIIKVAAIQMPNLNNIMQQLPTSPYQAGQNIKRNAGVVANNFRSGVNTAMNSPNFIAPVNLARGLAGSGGGNTTMRQVAGRWGDTLRSEPWLAAAPILPAARALFGSDRIPRAYGGNRIEEAFRNTVSPALAASNMAVGTNFNAPISSYAPAAARYGQQIADARLQNEAPALSNIMNSLPFSGNR